MPTNRKKEREDQLAEFPELREQYESLLKARGLVAPESALNARTVRRRMRHYGREMKRDGRWWNATQDREGAQILYDESRIGLSSVIDNRRREIEWIIASMADRRRHRVFVGEYPHGSLNAQSLVVDHRGVLILINTGLMMFIHQASKLVAKEVPTWPIEALPTPMHDRRTTQELLAEIVIAYLLYGSSAHARQLPALGGKRGVLSAALTASAEQFAIAHEYSHVLVGHLDPGLRAPSSRQLIDLREQRLRNPDFVKKSQKQEYEADGHALAIAINGRNFAPSERDAKVREISAYAGACFLFGLERLVEETRVALKLPSPNRGTSTHPAPEVRRQHLRGFAHQVVPQSLAWGDGLAGWVADVTPGTVANARSFFADSTWRRNITPLVF